MDILDLQDLESVYKDYEAFSIPPELWKNLEDFQKMFLIIQFYEKHFPYLYEEIQEKHPASPALEEFLNSFKII